MGYYIKQQTDQSDQSEQPDYQALADKFHQLDSQQPEPIGDVLKQLFDHLMTGDHKHVTGSEFDWGVESDDTL